MPQLAELLSDIGKVTAERRELLAQLRQACIDGDRDAVLGLASKLAGLTE